MVAFLLHLGVASLFISTVLTEPGLLKLDFKAERKTGLTKRASDGYLSAPLAESPDQLAYFVNITVGTPPQPFTVKLDTGSSNLFLPNLNACAAELIHSECEAYGIYNPENSSSYSQFSDNPVTLSYGLGTTIGYLANETVRIQGAELFNQSIVNAFNLTDQGGFGLMGISYAIPGASSKEEGIVRGTVVDSLYDQGFISRRAFSLYLNDRESGSGSVIFGGTDTDEYTGELVSLLMSPNRKGAYDFYAVTLSSVTFNSGVERKVLSPANMTSRTILDSGTTACIFPEAIANQLIEGVGAVFNAAQVTYFVPCAYRNSNASVELTFNGPGGPTIAIPMNQLVGQDSGDTFGDGVPACSFDVLPLSADNEAATDASLLGDSFLRSAYVVYDLDNHEVAIAQARLNSTSENIKVLPSGSGGLPDVASTATVIATHLPAPTAPPSGGLFTIAPNATAFPSSADQPSFTLDVAGVTSATTTGGVQTGSSTSGASSILDRSALFTCGVVVLAAVVVLGGRL